MNDWYSALERELEEDLEDFDDFLDDILLLTALGKRCRDVIGRAPALFRRRWESQYLKDLAEREGSFMAEYRVDPKGFDILHQLLDPLLQANSKMASLAMSKSKSPPITTESRL
eukprot:gene4203-5255_t